MLSLDQALNRLASRDARLAQIVELRCLAGLSVEETAEALGLSATTVKREWRIARTLLMHDLNAG
jgi:DNA-directed RNA polymerase specialized sigma24 family protein